MPNYRNTKSISLLLLAALLWGSCSENKSVETYEAHFIEGEAQGTTYTIIADDEKLASLKPKIKSILLDFDRCLSSYRDSSIVSMFSKAGAGKHQYTDINGYFQRCLILSEEVYAISGGAFDPSVFPLVSAWGFMKDPALEMTQSQVDSVKSLIGFSLGLDYLYQPKSGDVNNQKVFTIEKLRPTLRFDFNAIAQGLAVDVLCEYLDQQGFSNYYVEIGGELRVKGKNKDGEFWRIGIDVASEKNAIDPSERELSCVISVNNQAVATSGSYRKFYEKDGVKRSHTIDPQTGFPVKHSLLSATVVASNAAFADAMATVFMVWGKEKSIDFLTKNPEHKLEVLFQFMNEKGEIGTYKSPGLSKMILVQND